MDPLEEPTGRASRVIQGMTTARPKMTLKLSYVLGGFVYDRGHAGSHYSPEGSFPTALTATPHPLMEIALYVSYHRITESAGNVPPFDSFVCSLRKIKPNSFRLVSEQRSRVLVALESTQVFCPLSGLPAFCTCMLYARSSDSSMTPLTRTCWGGVSLVIAALLVGLGFSSLAPAIAPSQSTWAQRAPDRPERTYSEALRLYHDRHYVESARTFKQFRSRYPDDPNVAESFYYEAQAMLALNRESAAVRLLRQLQREHPTHPMARQAQLSLSQFFVEEEDFDRARSTLLEIVAGDPDPEDGARALFQLGSIYSQQGDLDRALNYYRRLTSEYEDSDLAPDAQYAIGSTLLQQEKYDEAAAAFETLGERYPDSPLADELGLALADVYYQLEDYERVIEEIERRKDQLEGETLERAQFLLAESYNHLRDSENAIVYYRRFTEENPDSPYHRPALFGLAWNYHFEESYQWAADHFARARDGADDEMAQEALYYEAANRYLANEQSEAADRYREFLDTWPDHELAGEAQYELAMIHYEDRDWEQANAAFQAVVDEHPGLERLGEAYYMLGNTHIALGDFDAALATYDEAIALDAAPASLREDVAFQSAWLLYDTGQYEEARSAFMELLEDEAMTRYNEDALFWGAESHFQIGQYNQARQLFQRYLNEYPEGEHLAAAQYALGWTHFRQERYQPASQWFEQFLATYAQQDEDVPYRQDAILRLADSYYAQRRYSEAVERYAQVRGDGEDYALYQSGQALYFGDQPEQAIERMNELVEEHPESPWREQALYRTAFINFQTENFQAAIDAYQNLIESHPDHELVSTAKYGIGDSHFNAGDFEAAVDAYERVLYEHPESEDAIDAATSIQFALLALDDIERVDDIIDSFAEQNPDSRLIDELRFRRAEALYQSGQASQAETEMLQFVRTSSDDALLPEAYYYLGLIYTDDERYDEAEGYLRQVVDDFAGSPRQVEAARRLGDLYLEREEYVDAMEAYRLMAEATDNPNELSQARYGESQALLGLDRREDARDVLETAIDDAPDDAAAMPARLGLARLYEDEGRTDEAIDLYRTVANNADGETGAESLFRLGSLLIDLGEPREALEELGRMPGLFAGFPDWMARGYLEQARAYRTLDQPGEAARLYDQVMSQYAGTPHAETAAEEREAL